MILQNKLKNVKEPVAAWEDGDALYLAIPSSRGGNYIVGVKPTDDGRLAITHRCTATAYGQRCWHMQAAYKAYYEWRWWEEPLQRVVFFNKPLQLNPEWRQIPIPGELPDLEGFLDVGVSTA